MDLLEPFRVGYHKKDSIHKQDGYISSLMLFNVLLAFGVSTTLGRLLSSDQSEHIRKSTVKLYFSFYLAISIALLLLLIFVPKVQKIYSNLQVLKASGNFKPFKKGRILKYIPILGLITFIIGIIAIDIMQIASYSTCVGVYRGLDDPDFYQEAVATIILHLVRSIFCTLIVVFAIAYPRDQVFFYRTVKVRFTFVVITTALFWLWLDAELHQANESYESDISDWSGPDFNCTDI